MRKRSISMRRMGIAATSSVLALMMMAVSLSGGGRETSPTVAASDPTASQTSATVYSTATTSPV
ncbi:MAG TPA: hypothetical protein VIL27_08100, partial [Clostridia bacterium]